ncbi:MAG: hypothetical protein ACJ73D_05380 [Pyrinomonadaceae bacterium]
MLFSLVVGEVGGCGQGFGEELLVLSEVIPGLERPIAARAGVGAGSFVIIAAYHSGIFHHKGTKDTKKIRY